MAVAAALQAELDVGAVAVPPPGKYGIPVVFGTAVKSLGLPTKSQASPKGLGLKASPVPLKSLVKSCTAQGVALCKVTMELICQPCRICPGECFPGRR